MTLVELGLPFEMVHVDVRSKPEWYLTISPKGKVPALVNLDDGATVYQSAICNEYLVDFVQSMAMNPDDTDKAGSNSRCSLMPTAPSDRARLRLLNDHVDSQIIPAQYAFLMNTDSERDKELGEAFATAWSTLENRLEERGPYLMGSDFTLSDVHALPFFLRAKVSLTHFKGYNLAEQFPHLSRWYDLCSKRECCRAAGKSEKELIDFYTSYMKWRK
jgi:glutathione S-transferase